MNQGDWAAMTDVTKADLWDVRDRLMELIEDGFKSTHARQDFTNGRINKCEAELGRHDERLKNIAHEVFRRRSTDTEQTSTVRADEAPITRRDLRLAGYVLAGAASVLGFLFKVLPWALKAVQP
jgi:hypothetical protein